MTYNVFGETLSLTQSINQHHLSVASLWEGADRPG